MLEDNNLNEVVNIACNENVSSEQRLKNKWMNLVIILFKENSRQAEGLFFANMLN
jgi:RNA polymerase subunit RPABC4/transcription elongation factor Spt4